MLVMSAATVLLILLVKVLFKYKFTPKFQYYIWALLFIRLLFPVMPQSDISLFNFFSGLPIFNTDPSQAIRETVNSASIQDGVVSENNMPAAIGSDMVKDSSETGLSPADISKVDLQITGIKSSAGFELFDSVNANRAVIAVYLFVVLLALTFTAVSNSLGRRRLKRELKPCCISSVNDTAAEIKRSLKIKRNVPVYIGHKSMQVGVIHPIIVIAEENVEDCRMVLAHEFIHLKYLDNLTGFVFALLECVYWFNPLLIFAGSWIENDMELLCDLRAVEKFGLRREEYAMLLFRSADRNTRGGEPIATLSMSKAGNQLIRRLRFLSKSGKRRTGAISRIISMVLIISMAAVCLTNPITAIEAQDSSSYIRAFAEMTGFEEGLPSKNDKMTVRGFTEMLFCFFAKADLPSEARIRANNLIIAGCDSFVERMVKAEIETYGSEEYRKAVSEIFPDSVITREQAAFLMSCFVILLQRDTLYMGGSSEVYLPNQLTESEFSELAASAVNGYSKYDDIVASYEKVSYDTLPYGLTHTDGEKASVYVYSAYDKGSQYIDRLTSAVRTYKDYSLVPENMSTHVALNGRSVIRAWFAFPFVIPASSFTKRLAGTVYNESNRSFVESCYVYDEKSENYKLNFSLSEQELLKLTEIIKTQSSYTYEMLLEDHSLCGFSYSSFALSSEEPSRLYTSGADGDICYYVYASDYFERLCYNAADSEISNGLASLFEKSDPTDKSLNARQRAAIINKFGTKEPLYIRDPYASGEERAILDKALNKYTDIYKNVYLNQIRESFDCRDADEISEYAKESVSYLYRCGVFTKSQKFSPEKEVDFAGACGMIMRLYASMSAG